MPDIEIPSINMVVVTSSERSGLMVENITPQLGEFFGVKNGNGVLIRSVDKGSRAEKAGLRAGDIIVKVNDQWVHDTSDFTHAVRSRKGTSVNVGVMRDKKEQNLNLSLPSRRESSDLIDEEESWDNPLIEEDAAVELSDVRQEVALLRPEITLAIDSARKSADEVRNELCNERKVIRLETAKQKREVKKQMDKLKLEIELLSRDTQDNWL
jgi:membrane-associated protease RseP (regulator of RpoE activity)